MMGNVFKVFAVFTAVVSVAMMGVAISTNLVAPDMRSAMNTEAMKNYVFEKSTGENPTWKVTRRFSIDPANPNDRGTVGTFPTPYEAVIKAHQDLKTQLSNRASLMATDTKTLQDQVKFFEATQKQDAEAVNARIAQLQQVAAVREDEAKNASAALEALSVKSREIREETALRRTDVLRLRHELDEMRTDFYRLEVIRRDLTDRLLRLQIENGELEARKAQIQGGSSPAVDQKDPGKVYNP
jgi:hypothetical protein